MTAYKFLSVGYRSVSLVPIKWGACLLLFSQVALSQTISQQQKLLSESASQTNEWQPNYLEFFQKIEPAEQVVESVEVAGTERISSEFVANLIDLSSRKTMNQSDLIEIRSLLLSLGLFEKVYIYKTKGSAPGKINLKLECEDNESVSGNWGANYLLGFSYGEPRADTFDPSANPLHMKLGLTMRNVLSRAYRFSSELEFAGDGEFYGASLAYGLPKYFLSDHSFEANVKLLDTQAKYMEVLGFGGIMTANWFMPNTTYGQFIFGPALYFNKKEKFAMPFYPKFVAGPLLQYRITNQIQSFLPSEGYTLNPSILFSSAETGNAVVAIESSYTFASSEFSRLHLGIRTAAVGSEHIAFRSKAGFSWKFSSPGTTGGLFFMDLNYGTDRTKYNYSGSSADIGFRMYGKSLITELSFKITRSIRHYEDELTSGVSE